MRKPQTRFDSSFIFSAAIILFLTGLATLFSAATGSVTLAHTGSWLILHRREVLMLSGALEVSLSTFLVVGRSPELSLRAIAYVSALFLLGSFLLRFFQSPNPFNYSSAFAARFLISPKTASHFGMIEFGWLFIGSFALLARHRRDPQNSANAKNRANEKSNPITRSSMPAATMFGRLLLVWGIGAALLAGLLFGQLNSHTRSAFPSNWDQISKEIYSIASFRANPVVNHRGTLLVYAENAEIGLRICQLNLATLQTKELAACEAADCAYPKAFDLFGWSPDDRYLAYTTAVQDDWPWRRVYLCDGSTGSAITFFETPGILQQGIWLTTNSLVFLDSSYGLSIYNLERDAALGGSGKQGLLRLRPLKIIDNAYALTRISDRSIGYASNGDVWQLDLPSNRAVQLTHLTSNVVEWLDYAPANSGFLFCSVESDSEKDRFLFRLNPRATQNAGLDCLTASHSFKGQWIQDGTGFAYVGTRSNRNFLALVTKDETLRTNLFVGGHVRSYAVSPGGDKLYAVASLGSEPPAIWEYGIAGRALRDVVSALRHPLTVAKVITPVERAFTNAGGEKIDYYYLPPAGLLAGKKYPVVIDRPNDSRFDHAAQFLANSGIFYASVNRYGLASSDRLLTAFPDTLALREELLKNPNIDPHRIYIAGRSASTPVLSKLVDTYPTLWRGAILLSPIAVPELTNAAAAYPSLFIAIGNREDPAALDQCERLAQKACQLLIPVQSLLDQPAGHWFEGIRLSRKRYRSLAEFILADF